MSYLNQQFAILDENDRLKLVTLDQWLDWMRTHREGQLVGRDEIDGYLVSTIFLGIDHQFHPHGRPVYWETMIFDPPAGRTYLSGEKRELGDDIYCERYSSLAEARAGHAQAIQWLKTELEKQ
jgi:hypothetical protein